MVMVNYGFTFLTPGLFIDCPTVKKLFPLSYLFTYSLIYQYGLMGSYFSLWVVIS